ncbi:MAG: hypothetical protein ACAI38_00610 [Myxococcota bacterium]|nr:hypothetical protein [Myxococcota bacterium]
MLLANLVLTMALAADESSRFHLLESQLTVATQVGTEPASKKCPSLYPKVAPQPPEPLSTPLPDAALKKSLAEAFGGRTRASACVYGVQGVRRQDPRYGMRQLTLEVAPPLAPQGRLRLLLRTVVSRFETMHDVGHNNAEVYAGVSY